MNTAEPFLVRHRVAVIAVLGLLTYVPFLGLRDLWYPDEPDIGEVCRAMFLSGDWIVPHRNGEPWIDYWPGLYWAGATASTLLGGISEFALRLPSALGATLLAMCTCVFASRRYGARSGLWAGVLLLTFQQFAFNAAGFRPDVLFTLFMASGVMLYASGAGESPRWWPRILGFALFGLAVLVKGPLGLLLPGLVLTLWHVGRREWSRLFVMAPLSLAAIAVALPWALACAGATSDEWFWGEIHAQNFQRFDEGGRGHIKPWYYYLTHLWVDLAPWSPLLPFAVARLWRSPRRGDRHGQLALWWFGAMLAFLSYAATKRQLYMLPAYPAAALLLAPYLAAVGTGSSDGSPDPRPARWLTVFMAALLAVLGIGLLIGGLALDAILAQLTLDDMALRTANSARVPALIVGPILAALGWWIHAATRRRESQAALGRTAVAMAAAYALLAALVLPAANELKGYAPAGQWIREQIGPDEDRIGLLFPTLAHHKMGAFGYYTGALVVILQDEDGVDAFFEEHPESIVLVQHDSLHEFDVSRRTDWSTRALREVVAGNRHYTAFHGPD